MNATEPQSLLREFVFPLPTPTASPPHLMSLRASPIVERQKIKRIIETRLVEQEEKLTKSLSFEDHDHSLEYKGGLLFTKKKSML